MACHNPNRKSGECFEVWFDAENDQTIDSLTRAE